VPARAPGTGIVGRVYTGPRRDARGRRGQRPPRRADHRCDPAVVHIRTKARDRRGLGRPARYGCSAAPAAPRPDGERHGDGL